MSSLLAADSGLEGRKRVRALLGEVCSDEAFVATYLGAIRQILYEDPELGFCIVGHVEQNSRQSRPHDHGPTWADKMGSTSKRSQDEGFKVPMTRRPFGAPGEDLSAIFNEGNRLRLVGVKALRCVFLTIFPHTAGVRR